MDGPVSALAELSKSMGGGGEPSPKTWFVNPNEMLDSMGMGYQKTPSTVTYETLRVMSMRNSVIASIIQTRVNQVASFCQTPRNQYEVGFEIRHRDPHHKMTTSDKDFAKRLTRYILNCGEDYNIDRDDFESFTRKVIRDRLTFDQLNFEKIPRFDRLPSSFHAVDASTIRLKRRPTSHGEPIAPHDHEDEVRYVQLIEGVEMASFTPLELAFGVANPRTDIRVNGYGLSELELLMTTVTYHLFAEQWNQKVFSQGSTVKGILNITGNIPQNQLENFKRQWIAQVSGVSNAWRTPILNTENLQWVPLQPSNNDMGYQQWLEYLIKVACAIYLIDPAEINFDLRGSQGMQPAFMSSNEAQQKVSKDRGLQPLMRFYFNQLNKHLIWPFSDQWEISPVGLDAKTEQQAIQLRQTSLQSHRTLNEIRAEEGRPPVENGDVVLNPVYIGYLQQQQAAQQAQQQAQAAQQAPQGPQGAPEAGPAQSPGMQEAAQQQQATDQFAGAPSADMESETAAGGNALERYAGTPEQQELLQRYYGSFLTPR
jgi:hypothetical protein